ncbi:hypothetical protein Glove_121g75 [Diversispora epigaea]|uniref:HMG box domain-containing protein n=1 Tax=Diversispora epigaea TaxID=1348612 RepID=A0A397J1V9_9GLOM|nr:hypothetical protein Glove_121g75 [Diversispora epigaea]
MTKIQNSRQICRSILNLYQQPPSSNNTTHDSYSSPHSYSHSRSNSTTTSGSDNFDTFRSPATTNIISTNHRTYLNANINPNINTAASTPKLPDPKIIEQVISEIDDHTLSEISRQITVPIENLIRPTAKSRKGGIPRPQNPFVIYRRDLQAKLTATLGPDVGSHLPFVSKEASRKWEIEREDIKNIYEVMAELAKKVHERTYPDYVYKPRKRALKATLNRSIFDHEIYLMNQRNEDLRRTNMVDSQNNNNNNNIVENNYMHSLNTHNQLMRPSQTSLPSYHNKYNNFINDQYRRNQLQSSQYNLSNNHSTSSSSTNTTSPTTSSMFHPVNNSGVSIVPLRDEFNQQHQSVWPSPKSNSSNYYKPQNEAQNEFRVVEITCDMQIHSYNSLQNSSQNAHNTINNVSSNNNTYDRFLNSSNTNPHNNKSITQLYINNQSITPPLTSCSLSRSTSFDSSTCINTSPIIPSKSFPNSSSTCNDELSNDSSKNNDSGINKHKHENDSILLTPSKIISPRSNLLNNLPNSQNFSIIPSSCGAMLPPLLSTSNDNYDRMMCSRKFLDNLSIDFTELLENGDEHNVLIEVGEYPLNNTFKVHSTVLFCRCPSLYNQLKNLTFNENNVKIIKRPNSDVKVFEPILKLNFSKVFHISFKNNNFVKLPNLIFESEEFTTVSQINVCIRLQLYLHIEVLKLQF